MNKVVNRLLIFFIGIPFVLSLVYFDFYNHLVLNIAITIASALGACEFYDMLAPKHKLFRKPFVVIFSCLLPILTYNFIYFGLSIELVPWFFVFEMFILMGAESFFQKEFTDSLSKISYSLLIIFYTGLLSTFISRMTVLPNSRYFISLYFILVFMCDSCAWFFGVLFGKNNRGFLAASPNKSIVGFFGGIFGSVVSGVLVKMLFPEVFFGSYSKIIVLGLITSIGSIIGDLIESVFKRSAVCKDSGKIVPGRGGILDSIDSLLFAAPVFYAGVHFLFN